MKPALEPPPCLNPPHAVQHVEGIGPKLAEIQATKAIATVGDLLIAFDVEKQASLGIHNSPHSCQYRSLRGSPYC
jgi:hypothetical protein